RQQITHTSHSIFFIRENQNQIMFTTNPLWIFTLNYVLLSTAWNLNQLNLRASDYVVTDVSKYYIRSFLCIKSSNESMKIPTLIETIWPENLLLMISPKIFPSDLSHARRSSDCNGIIQAVGTAVNKAGLLWVIDNGSRYCPPKLLIFDLMTNEEIQRFAFNIRRHAFTSIKSVEDGSYNPRGRSDSQAIITLDRADFLIFYSLNKRRWWKLQLITSDGMVVIPKDIAILGTDKLYASDECGHLWTAEVDVHKWTKAKLFNEVRVEFIADLLGTSTALTIDPNGSLLYYLPRDGAVVRWNSRKPLRAENHDVLYLSPTPIVKIIFGSKGSVWIVKESPDYVDDHCKRILLHF
ncbi:Major royal jelly protein 3, partial [Pseudolycoriella hygida]